MGLLGWLMEAARPYIFSHKGFGGSVEKALNKVISSVFQNERVLSPVGEAWLQATRSLTLPHDHSQKTSWEAWGSL